VLTIVGRGADLEAARVQADAAADVIRFDGVQRRHDIGAIAAVAGAADRAGAAAIGAAR
jgi:phosphoribosylamine-glycine ligase